MGSHEISQNTFIGTFTGLTIHVRSVTDVSNEFVNLSALPWILQIKKIDSANNSCQQATHNHESYFLQISNK